MSWVHSESSSITQHSLRVLWRCLLSSRKGCYRPNYNYFLKFSGTVKIGFWTVTSLFCGALLIFHITQITRYFFAYRVNVVVSLVKDRELTFPAVTVCNMNPVKSSAVAYSPELKAALNPVTLTRRKRAGTTWNYLRFTHFYFVSLNLLT